MNVFAWLGFILGLIFGSFANVVIHRLPLGQSIVSPRSACPACGHKLAWWENVPLVSFALLRGRCRSCKAPISWRYPLVELLFGLWGLALMLKIGPTPELWDLAGFLLEFALGGILITASFIDFDHYILPDELTLPGAALAIAGAIFVLGHDWRSTLAGAAVGAGVFWLLQQFYRRLRGVEGLGTGDIKLMLLLGGWLGLKALPVVVMAGSVLGLLAGFAAMRAQPGSGLRARIPFGPFLSLGGMLYALWGDWFWRWYLG